MSWRIKAARLVIRLGSFIQELAVTVLKPRDFKEFGFQSYSREKEVAYWSGEGLVDGGLSGVELDFLKKTGLDSGNALILGVGGGREALDFARRGFEVTGVDFVPEMIQAAQENARQRGLEFRGLVQDISRLDVPPETYDLAWLSSRMYSSIPRKVNRVGMLKRIHRALKPGGFFSAIIIGVNERPFFSERNL
jgi:SAM-dependent methyltransferase